MMSKDLWIAEYERIGEDFASGVIEEQDVRERLQALGFDHNEIEDHLSQLLEDLGWEEDGLA